MAIPVQAIEEAARRRAEEVRERQAAAADYVSPTSSQAMIDPEVEAARERQPVVQYTPIEGGPGVDQEAINDQGNEPGSAEEALAQAAAQQEAEGAAGAGGGGGGGGVGGTTQGAKVVIRHGKPGVGAQIAETAGTVAELRHAALEKDLEAKRLEGQAAAVREASKAEGLKKLEAARIAKEEALLKRREAVTADLEKLSREGFGEEAVWQSRGTAARVSAAIGSAIGAGLAFWTGQPNHVENSIRASIDAEIAGRRGKGAMYQQLLERYGDEGKAIAVQDELNRKRLLESVQATYESMVAKFGGPKSEAEHYRALANIENERGKALADGVEKASSDITTEHTSSVRGGGGAVGGGGAPSAGGGRGPSGGAGPSGSRGASGGKSGLAAERLALSKEKEATDEDKDYVKRTRGIEDKSEKASKALGRLDKAMATYGNSFWGVPGTGIGANSPLIDKYRKIRAGQGDERSKEGIRLQSSLAEIINDRVHEISGAAVTPTEMPRLLKEIDLEWPADLIREKIEEISQREARRLLSEQAANPAPAKRVEGRKELLKQGAANFNARVERVMREKKLKRQEAEVFVRAEDRAKRSK